VVTGAVPTAAPSERAASSTDSFGASRVFVTNGAGVAADGSAHAAPPPSTVPRAVVAPTIAAAADRSHAACNQS
jgi:hypothetical protein